ncbi:hypothetical protein SAMN05421878_102187 [Actinobaculum suis]|uniref:Uncharacterized protein n=1 Tax=Actinobaculum suis TaxID=1657 RepID=A0A1G7AEL0_9ACTO|nr:hypothetical protein SAMN05421878_102187 [Actinobaculum suis]
MAKEKSTHNERALNPDYTRNSNKLQAIRVAVAMRGGVPSYTLTKQNTHGLTLDGVEAARVVRALSMFLDVMGGG